MNTLYKKLMIFKNRKALGKANTLRILSLLMTVNNTLTLKTHLRNYEQYGIELDINDGLIVGM